jgi:Na+-transporting methylmalonyl-CoA/oxaloacetate decarboxylase gamma subunit
MEIFIVVAILAVAAYFAYAVATGNNPIYDVRKAADLNKDGSVDSKDAAVAVEKVQTRTRRVVAKNVEKAKTRTKKS